MEFKKMVKQIRKTEIVMGENIKKVEAINFDPDLTIQLLQSYKALPRL